MSETPTTSQPRIRWGWFVGCIALGLAAILLGLFAVPDAVQIDYLAGVLGNIGTTLLLVGIVVLLERRIIDGAVRIVRAANASSREAIRARTQELDDRVAAEWESATTDNIPEKTAETTRLVREFTKLIVDDASRAT